MDQTTTAHVHGANEATSEVHHSRIGARSEQRWRKRLSVTLIVLFGVITPIAMVAVWANLIVLDTDRYVESVTPLASDDRVQDAAASAVSRAVMTRVESSRVLSALPLTGENVEDAALTAIDTEAFRTIWESANRDAHIQLVEILTGEGNQNDRLTLDLGAILTNLDIQLDVAGRRIDLGDAVGDTPVTLVVFEADQLDSARRWIRLLDGFAVLLPAVSVVFVIGGIASDDNRLRATRRLGIALAIGMLALIGALVAGRSLYLGALEADVPKEAATAVFDIVTRSLWWQAAVFALIGGAIAIVARFTGRRARNVATA